MKRISEELEKRINTHIELEENSSRLYRAMGEWFEYNGWFNAAKLWKKYADEEMTHCSKFYQYLQDRDVLPITPMVKEQSNEYESMEKIVEASYKHEIEVSKELSKTATMALKEGDLTVFGFMHWFIQEQIEEEAKMMAFLDRIDMLKQTNTSLFFMEEAFEEALG